MNRLSNEDMQAGMRYRVLMEDCCIEGEFTAIFLGWKKEDGTIISNCRKLLKNIEERNTLISIWDNGVSLGPFWGQWAVEVAESRQVTEP